MPFTLGENDWNVDRDKDFFVGVSKQRSEGSPFIQYMVNKDGLLFPYFGDSKHNRHTALTHGDLITIF